MKFILTESKLSKAIETHFNKNIESYGFDWVDKIEVNVVSTSFVGWNEEFPIYEYSIYFKDDEIPTYEIQSELFDKISTYHSLIFGDGESKTYFSTKSVLPDGRIKSFPLIFR